MADSRTIGHRVMVVVAVFLVCAIAASEALAQASIAGVVRDASGAVLPGVTVEAASPVLIEKARTVVTDGAGQYRIEQLRLGTYAGTGLNQWRVPTTIVTARFAKFSVQIDF